MASTAITQNTNTNDLPIGGTSGQQLVKQSATDYDVAWETSNGLSTGGSAEEVLIKQSGTNYDADWGVAPKMTFNTQTGTTYTLLSSDLGKTVTLDNASAITLTLPDSLATGFHCTLVQKGAGQVSLSLAGGGNIRNIDSHTKLKGQYAVATLLVESNAGSAPEYYLIGATDT
jgi:hypothetical protein